MLAVHENLADRMVLAEFCVKVKAPGGSAWRCVAAVSVRGVLIKRFSSPRLWTARGQEDDRSQAEASESATIRNLQLWRCHVGDCVVCKVFDVVWGIETVSS